MSNKFLPMCLPDLTELATLAGNAYIDIPKDWDNPEEGKTYEFNLRSSIGERFANAQRKIRILQPVINHPMMLPILLSLTQLPCVTKEDQDRLNEEIIAAASLIGAEEVFKPLLRNHDGRKNL